MTRRVLLAVVLMLTLITAKQGSAGGPFGQSYAIESKLSLASTYPDEDSLGRVVAASFPLLAVTSFGPVQTSDGSNYWGGTVSIFRHDGSQWRHEASLKSGVSTGDESDCFGGALATDGKRVVVGAPCIDDKDKWRQAKGAAYVFVQDAGVWTQTAKLVPSERRGQDGFGTAVALSGDSIIVGAPIVGGKRAPGTVFVFEKRGGRWKQTAILDGSRKRDFFGGALAATEKHLVVAAGSLVDGRHHGVAFVFEKDAAGQWVEMARLTGGETWFGARVAIDRRTIIVDSQHREGVFVFRRKGNSWSEEARLRWPSAKETLMRAIAISGRTVVVGIPRAISSGGSPLCGSLNLGEIRVFTRRSRTWLKGEVIALPRDAIAKPDELGWSVALDGTRLIAGAPSDCPLTPGGFAPNRGAVWVFQR